jgi:hypothetical protein
LRFLSKHVQAIFLVVGLVLLSGLLLQSQSGNQRVDSFLRSLSTFPTINDASKAYLAARFTDSERKQLETQLRNPIYKPTIDRLIRTVTKESTRKMRPAPKSIASRKQEQAQMIENINTRTRIKVQNFLSSSVKMVGSGAVQAAIGAAPKITSLSESSVYPNTLLMIRGTNFLPQGTVQFTFGSTSFNGLVESWANDLIVARVPPRTSGIREMDGNVTVRKQNSQLRADAVIRFKPLLDYVEILSDQLSNPSAPYDGLIAFFLLLQSPSNAKWCSSYTISFPGFPPAAELKNDWVIDQFEYYSDGGSWELDLDENPADYIGQDWLPDETRGSLCFPILGPRIFHCQVWICGPLGLPYR